MLAWIIFGVIAALATTGIIAYGAEKRKAQLGENQGESKDSAREGNGHQPSRTNSIKKFFKELFKILIFPIKALFKGIKVLSKGIFKSIKFISKGIYKGVKTLAKGVIKTVKFIAKGILKTIKVIGKTVAKVISAPFKLIANISKKIKNRTTNKNTNTAVQSMETIPQKQKQKTLLVKNEPKIFNSKTAKAVKTR